jgi:hypothetical protein
MGPPIAVFILLAVAALGVIVAQLIEPLGQNMLTLSPSSANLVRGALVYFIVASVVGLVVMAVFHSRLERLWGQLFPDVEFKLGDNVEVVERHRDLRRAIWAFPVTAVLLPLIKTG